MRFSKVFAFYCLSCFSALVAASASAAETVFDDVNVIPMDRERVVPRQRVIVSDGRIIAMGAPSILPVPEGALRIDAKGAYLMPGLAEMHAHVPGERAEEQTRRDVLMLYLANGITTIRGMLGDPSHLALRERLEAGESLGPRLFTSGPSFNGQSVTSPEQAADRVRAQAAAGYDFLKLHPGLEREEYQAIVVAADALGIPYAGHVSIAVGVPLSLEAHQATIDHLDGYAQELVPATDPLHGVAPDFFGINLSAGMDASRIPDLARSTRNAGVWNVPTQSLLENILYAQSIDALMARPEMDYVRLATRDDWRERVEAFRRRVTPESGERYLALRRALIKALQDEGAGLLLGSDAPQMMNVPGFSLHEELAYLVNAGLTPYQALRSGTMNVASFLGEEDAGSVAVGQRADLVLLSQNPLEDIGNARSILGVMLAGRWLDREALDAALAEIRERKI